MKITDTITVHIEITELNMCYPRPWSSSAVCSEVSEEIFWNAQLHLDDKILYEFFHK